MKVSFVKTTTLLNDLYVNYFTVTKYLTYINLQLFPIIVISEHTHTYHLHLPIMKSLGTEGLYVGNIFLFGQEIIFYTKSSNYTVEAVLILRADPVFSTVSHSWQPVD